MKTIEMTQFIVFNCETNDERPKSRKPNGLVQKKRIKRWKKNVLQIQYIHDGSESTTDRMILELRLTGGADSKLPSYLEGGLRFPLGVNITPVNDPPVLEIPTTKVLRLAQVSSTLRNPKKNISLHQRYRDLFPRFVCSQLKDLPRPRTTILSIFFINLQCNVHFNIHEIFHANSDSFPYHYYCYYNNFHHYCLNSIETTVISSLSQVFLFLSKNLTFFTVRCEFSQRNLPKINDSSVFNELRI